jgi:hypothetical protein
MATREFLLITIILFAGYTVLNTWLNYVFYSLLIKKIKLPLPRKFKNKVSPIYKLVERGSGYFETRRLIEKGSGCYEIEKWGLEYTEIGGWRSTLIPLIGFFEEQKFVHIGTLGEFNTISFSNNNIKFLNSLDTNYEDLLNQKMKAELLKKAEDEIRLSPINKLNKKFNDNYIE